MRCGQCDLDPGLLTEAGRRRLGIVALPAILAEALTELEGDGTVR